VDNNVGDLIENGELLPFEPLGKPQKATEKEIAMNSRARSATLRVGIRN
jgi:16S rRNA C1402 N4-methylase RsmH